MLRWSNPSLTNPEMISHSQGGTSQKISDLVAKTSHGPLHKFKISFAIIFRFIILVQPILYLGNSDPSSKWLPHSISLHKDTKIHDYIYKMVDQNSFIRKRPFFANKHVTFAKLSRTPRLSFAGPMLGNNASYEDSFTTCQIMPENHGSLLDSLFKHWASITESLLRTDCCWLFFLQGLLTPPSTCTLTFARSFAELSRNFRENIPIHRPRRIEGKANTRGLGVWLSESRTFESLAAAFGACFLRLQKSSLGSDSGRCKDALQDHGVWLSRSLTFGSSAATYEGQSDFPKSPPRRELNQNQTEILRCPSPAGPQAAVGGSPLHNDYNIQLSRNLREKKCYFRELEKNFREGSQHNMNGLRN